MGIGGDDERRRRFAAHNALVGRSVRVRQRREQTFVSGVLYGVDPESGDVALVMPSSPPTASVAVKIILGHAVHSVELDPTMSGLTLESLGADTLAHTAVGELQRPTAPSDEECQACARRLCAFLDEVRLMALRGETAVLTRELSVISLALCPSRFDRFRRQSDRCAGRRRDAAVPVRRRQHRVHERADPAAPADTAVSFSAEPKTKRNVGCRWKQPRKRGPFTHQRVTNSAGQIS
jgi:hypothetical protein